MLRTVLKVLHPRTHFMGSPDQLVNLFALLSLLLVDCLITFNPVNVLPVSFFIPTVLILSRGWIHFATHRTSPRKLASFSSEVWASQRDPSSRVRDPGPADFCLLLRASLPRISSQGWLMVSSASPFVPLAQRKLLPEVAHYLTDIICVFTCLVNSSLY